MSDNNPFGAAGSTEVDPDGTDSRRTVVAVGAIAVVALGAGAFFLLGGDAEQPAPAPTVRAAAPAAPVAAEAVPVAATLPTPTDLAIGRNPFKVPGIYIPPVVSASAPGTATGTPAQPPVVQPPLVQPPLVQPPLVQPPLVQPPVVQPPVVQPPVFQPPAQRHQLVLVRVTGDGADRTAAFTIDGQEQTAKVGSIFGPSSQILLRELTEGPAGAWTATLQVGDGDPFDVVTGEPAYVQ